MRFTKNKPINYTIILFINIISSINIQFALNSSIQDFIFIFAISIMISIASIITIIEDITEEND